MVSWPSTFSHLHAHFYGQFTDPAPRDWRVPGYGFPIGLLDCVGAIGPSILPEIRRAFARDAQLTGVGGNFLVGGRIE
jgi:hypothetical protein